MFTVVLANEATAEISDEYYISRQLLEKLDIISSNELMNDDAILTRAEFIMYVARLIGISENPTVSANYFSDISKDYWAANLINYFAENGYISVGIDKAFFPDSQIKVAEAYKIMLEVLNYGELAKVNGGYPFGYLYVANQLKLYKNGLNGNISEHDAVGLLCDMAEIPFYEIVKVRSDGGALYEANDIKTILSIYYYIYSKEGFVDGVNGSYFSTRSTSENELLLDGEYYGVSNIEYPEKYIGRYVKMFYKDEKTEKKEAISINVAGRKDKCVVIEADRIDALSSDYTLYYYPSADSKQKYNLKVDRGVSLLYNGTARDTGITDAFNNIKEGYVCLTDRNGDGKYEYALIKNYKNVFTGHCDSEYKTIYDVIEDRVYDLSAYRHMNIYTSAYKTVGIDAIKEKRALLVAASGNEYIEIIISSEAVTGVVSTVESMDESRTITVDGKEFEISESTAHVDVGIEYKLYLNAFGKIIYSETFKNTGMTLGYVTGCSLKDGIDSVVEIRLFSEDGNFYIYAVKPKTVIDGERMDDTEIYNYFISADGKIKPQLIRYSLNTDKCIAEIDTEKTGASESEDNCLTQSPSSPDTELTAFSMGTTAKRRLGLASLVGPNTKVFLVPEVASIVNGDYEDEQFRIGNPASFVADTLHKYSAYKISRFNVYEDVVIEYCKPTTDFTSNVNIMLVNEVINGLNSKGDTIKKLKGLSGGGKVSVCVSQKFYSAKILPKSGDAILMITDVLGDMTDYVLLYDYANDTRPTGFLFNKVEWDGNICRSSISDSLSQSFVCTFGYAAIKAGSAVAMCAVKSDEYLNNISESIDLSSYSVMVYNSRARKSEFKAYIGSINDIKDIKSAGTDNCSRILIHYRYATVKDIIVYN